MGITSAEFHISGTKNPSPPFCVHALWPPKFVEVNSYYWHHHFWEPMWQQPPLARLMLLYHRQLTTHHGELQHTPDNVLTCHMSLWFTTSMDHCLQGERCFAKCNLQVTTGNIQTSCRMFLLSKVSHDLPRLAITVCEGNVIIPEVKCESPQKICKCPRKKVFAYHKSTKIHHLQRHCPPGPWHYPHGNVQVTTGDTQTFRKNAFTFHRSIEIHHRQHPLFARLMIIYKTLLTVIHHNATIMNAMRTTSYLNLTDADKFTHTWSESPLWFKAVDILCELNTKCKVRWKTRVMY